MNNAQMKIRGVNIGGWLLMEGYILHSLNVAEHLFKGKFRAAYGEKGLREFEKLFRDNFITEEDFRNIAKMGATAIRLPFNHRLLEEEPYTFREEGFTYLDKALKWADKHGIKVILDLHAAPGAQNHDWHGDSDGRALFWKKEENRDRACALWEMVADRYKDHPALLGYDLLNEPVLENTSLLKSFYKKAAKRIQAIDHGHTLFMEGSIWASKIDFLEDLIDDNITISIHAYQPLNYTFNFTPFDRYPGKIGGENWDDRKMHKYLEGYAKFARRNGIRILVGEFGVNWRGGCFGETAYLESILKTFDDYGFDYTYWTYKAIANNCFPDGIYQCIPNSKYIRREGPVFGWENYLEFWKTEKNEIVDFWRTKHFTGNKEIIKILSKYNNLK